jgi:hypothetical protein
VLPGGWVRRQFCEPLSALFRQWLICHLLSAIYFCRLCLLKVRMESSSLLLLSSPQHSEHHTLSVVCPFQFLVYCSGFWLLLFFLWGRGQSVQGAMLVYSRGDCGSNACCLFAHLLVCISQVGLEPPSVSTEALLVSQCNVA